MGGVHQASLAKFRIEFEPKINTEPGLVTVAAGRAPPSPPPHLQADDVGVAAQDLLHDGLLPVLPGERPGRAVAVQLAGGVLVTEHVVAHHGEQSWGGVERSG